MSGIQDNTSWDTNVRRLFASLGTLVVNPQNSSESQRVIAAEEGKSAVTSMSSKVFNIYYEIQLTKQT